MRKRMTPEEKAEREARWEREQAEREEATRQRHEWAKQLPPEGSLLEQLYNFANSVMKAYYSTPANRLWLENLCLKGELKIARYAAELDAISGQDDWESKADAIDEKYSRLADGLA